MIAPDLPPIEVTPRQMELMKQYCPGTYQDALSLLKTGDVIIRQVANSCKA
jgi:hypothetical protein